MNTNNISILLTGRHGDSLIIQREYNTSNSAQWRLRTQQNGRQLPVGGREQVCRMHPVREKNNPTVSLTPTAQTGVDVIAILVGCVELSISHYSSWSHDPRTSPISSEHSRMIPAPDICLIYNYFWPTVHLINIVGTVVY